MIDFLKSLLMRAAHWFDWFEREEKPGGAAAFDGSEILPGKLWLSGFIESWPTAQKITAVMNLAAEDSDPPTPPGCDHCDTPMYDLPPAPTPEVLDNLVGIIVRWLNGGYVVLAHCDKGDNRSAMVIIAVLIASRGMTLAEAVAFVRAARPSVGPHDFQVQALREYEKWLRMSKTQP